MKISITQQEINTGHAEIKRVMKKYENSSQVNNPGRENRFAECDLEKHAMVNAIQNAAKSLNKDARFFSFKPDRLIFSLDWSGRTKTIEFQFTREMSAWLEQYSRESWTSDLVKPVVFEIPGLE